MVEIVNFICDTRPTRQEIKEAIDYCISHRCVARLNYPMFGYMYIDQITANDTVDNIMEYYNQRTYGM